MGVVSFWLLGCSRLLLLFQLAPGGTPVSVLVVLRFWWLASVLLLIVFAAMCHVEFAFLYVFSLALSRAPRPNALAA